MIKKSREKMYCILIIMQNCSENKGADQLCGAGQLCSSF